MIAFEFPRKPEPPIAKRVQQMLAGERSAQALLEEARERAFRFGDLNAIAHQDWDAARAQAARLDEEAQAGRVRGPLHGVPLSIKDLFAVKGMPMTAGTRAPLPALGRAEAVAVERLRAAGAVIFGKTNMHEIALGATGENSWTGDVRNPYDPGRQAGGSSSGAAVAVACGIGVIGLGSDTGGSIRVPAAFCGLVGFKPTFGHVPLGGALPLSWTCDHAGPLARSVADARTAYEVLAQRSARAPTVARAARLAVPAAWLEPRLAPEVAQAFERLLARLSAAGAQIVPVPTPKLHLAWQCYTPIVRAEAAYVHREALAASGKGFSDLVLPALLEGQKITAAQYFVALAQRQEVRTELALILRDHDAMLLPTSPIVTPRRGQVETTLAGGATTSVREAVLGQTAPFSMCGLPALSLPYGSALGMPLGAQLIGHHDGDANLLALGEWVEHTLAR